ncbi:hypothetical protein [Pseudomarimonas arenosa]|uniref:Uncharacterized protein n=1 Tax=Pseudomarimonas arenosa TaxID=2774145 RepID=A0AAW3ZDA8_9GAMM|nr:hypothetical protein [Pseudomarimonas arenosa]MBD8524263.1 hypothetical protein [Pseudomarimonas arenosa]
MRIGLVMRHARVEGGCLIHACGRWQRAAEQQAEAEQAVEQALDHRSRVYRDRLLGRLLRLGSAA